MEKKGNTTKATVEGNTYVLVDEFQTVLHALYQLLEKNIKESESVTPRDLMHSMVEDVVQKEKEMRKDMSMKINRLEIENVKRIKAVKLEPVQNGLTIIGGDNQQGKTSVLDSIAWALGGERYKPSQSTREGSMPPRTVTGLINANTSRQLTMIATSAITLNFFM